MFTGQEAASDAINVSTEDTKLVENVASIYLNEKFSDVTFLVGGEKLRAHKAILAMKSKRFENLFDENPEEKEITISNTSPEAFRLFLKYIYTDTITTPTNYELFLQELILVHQYSVKHLKSAMVREINNILNTKNVCFLLNGANDNELVELLDACHSLVDQNTMEILSSDSFNHLTQKSLIQMVKRDTFLAPEIEIFKSIAKWCQRNDNIDNLVLECVRLSLLTVSEIVSIVWPTKLVNAEKLLEVISEITGNSSNNLLYRAASSLGENIPVLANGAEVTSELDTFVLSTDNNIDAKKNVQHPIDGKTGIIIRLSTSYCINHICMMLYDADDRYYSYYIETSLDRKKWYRIVDYSTYACRSVQNLYFEQQVVEYIKIVGTSNNKGSDFHLVFFQAFHKSKIPKTINSVICPEVNVATPENKAIVLEGLSGFSSDLLSGKNFSGSSHYFQKDPRSIIIQLAQPYLLSRMQFVLYTIAGGHDKYFIETSANKTD